MSKHPMGRWVDDEPVSPGVDWLVEDALPRKSIGFLAARSGRGKSFLAVDLMLSLARGKSFFGRAIDAPCASYLVAGEGGYGVTDRVRAAIAHKFGGEGAPMMFRTDAPDLLKAEARKVFTHGLRALDADMQARYGVPLRLVVFDTFARCFAIKDENDARSVSAATSVMADIAEATGATVMAVHHFGKDESAGMRGSSALRANADFVLAVPRKGKLVLEKCRDAPEGPMGDFTLRRVAMGVNAKGRPVSSLCVAVGDHGEEFEAVTTEPSAAGVLAECLAAALSEEGQIRLHPDTAETLNAVPMKSVRNRFVAKWDGSSNARRQAFHRARDNLDQFGVFHIAGEEWATEEALR